MVKSSHILFTSMIIGPSNTSPCYEINQTNFDSSVDRKATKLKYSLNLEAFRTLAHP